MKNHMAAKGTVQIDDQEIVVNFTSLDKPIVVPC
jgi:hypothetical protein